MSMRSYGPLPCLLLTLASLILWQSTAQATTHTIEPEKQLQYARQLYDEGQYRRAAEEFDRFAFFFPNNPQRPAAIFSAGRAFLQARESMTAMQYFQDLFTENGPMDELEVEARLMMAECYVIQNESSQAISQLDQLAARSPDPAVKDRAYARMTWIFIDQLDWAGARESLQRISVQGRERRDIAALERLLAHSDAIPRKSPALAGTLSIVPGGGQLYCGRYQDAVAALVVNGGLFWASYEAFDNDLNALGGMLALVGIGFYTANIYGAVSSAHKYNLRQQKGFAEQLKQSVRLNIAPRAMSSDRSTADAIGISFHFKF